MVTDNLCTEGEVCEPRGDSATVTEQGDAASTDRAVQQSGAEPTVTSPLPPSAVPVGDDGRIEAAKEGNRKELDELLADSSDDSDVENDDDPPTKNYTGR